MKIVVHSLIDCGLNGYAHSNEIETGFFTLDVQ